MNKFAIFFSAVALIALSTFAGINMLPIAQAGSTAASRTVVSEATVSFIIEKMNCAACPITVRKAMGSINGVKDVTVDFDKKKATVTYDPAVASVEQIGAASTNAGYPASLDQQK